MTFKDETYNEIISTIGSYKCDQVQTRVISKALDGSTYIQNIGLPAEEISATIIYFPEKETALKRADAQGSLISLTDEDEVIYGRIVSLELDHKWMNGKYSANILLVKEE